MVGKDGSMDRSNCTSDTPRDTSKGRRDQRTQIYGCEKRGSEGKVCDFKLRAKISGELGWFRLRGLSLYLHRSVNFLQVLFATLRSINVCEPQ